MKRTVLVLAGLISAASPLAGRAAASGEAPEASRIPVVTTAAALRPFDARVEVQGNVEAKNSAWVPARIKATLIALSVDEGDAVKAGKTALLRTDDLNLQNALEVSRLALAVAECSVREKEAGVERLEADLERKRKDYERQKRLFEADKIGTLDRVEEVESGYKQALASLKHGQTLVALAMEQQRQAAMAVRIAEKNLSDATVVAPISGVISQRLQEVGEMGDPATPAFRIVDLSRLEISAFLPAQHYAAIVPGQTTARVRVDSRDLGEHVVSYRAPVIESRLRVFEIKCLLENPPPGVAPGSMATLTVILRREEGLGVPKESITQRDGKNVIFRIESDTARQTVVETGMETDGWVQLRAPAFAAGTPVVTMGQFLLNDGVRVDLRPGSSAPALTARHSGDATDLVTPAAAGQERN